MPGSATIIVALAGTPEAATADFVCDGVADQVEINAAFAAAAAAGGGTVHLAPGNYSTTFPIAILQDGVGIEGDPGGGTTITPAPHWTSVAGPDGAALTGVVCVVGADDFAVRNLNVESGGVVLNGIMAVPDGVDGAGGICTNGVIEGNTIRMEQGHSYSIWSQRGEHIQILDNHVDGGGSVDNAHTSQEGIEIYGGNDVLISGNVITGIGNAAIQLGGLPATTPDCSVENIVVVGNQVSNCRIGVFGGLQWGAVGGPAHLRNVTIENNSFTGLFEGGLLMRIGSGNAGDPPEMAHIVFRDNQVELIHADGAGFNPAGAWFLNAAAAGETLSSDILVEGNSFTVVEADQGASPSAIHGNNSALIFLLGFAGVTVHDNDLDLAAANSLSRGIIAHFSRDFVFSDNRISDAAVFGIELSEVADYIVDGNRVTGWGTPYAAILAHNAQSGGVLTDNELVAASGSPGPFILVGGAPPAIVDGNTLFSGANASLAGSLVDNLTLIGSAVSGTGNGVANVITGNALANSLHGAGGMGDVLIGLSGNDIYFTDLAATQIVEAAGGGNDALYTSVSYTLAAGSDVETLSTNHHAATAAINLTGNAIANLLVGNQGANILNGGAGADRMIGFGGNDWYLLDTAADRVEELAGGGVDTIYAGFSYTLPTDQEVETLATTSQAGTQAINLTGNAMSNTVLGNAGANVLNGLGGTDYLVGLGGNDVYHVDLASDQVFEAAGQGVDTVYASASYELGAGQSVENLSTASHGATTAIDLIGNNLTNTLIGNAGVNRLDGKDGNDSLVGLGGADLFAFTTALGAGNVDTVSGFQAGLDKILLDDAAFAGLAPGALNPDAFATGAAAQDGLDRIVYNSANGLLYFDADGSGPGGAILFARLDPGLALAAGDFTVI